MLDPKKIIKKATENLNSVKSQKYGYDPESVEEKTLNNNYYRETCDFCRLFKVKKHADCYKRADISKDKTLRKQLRYPLSIDEKVLVLAGRLKQKMCQNSYITNHRKNFLF